MEVAKVAVVMVAAGNPGVGNSPGTGSKGGDGQTGTGGGGGGAGSYNDATKFQGGHGGFWYCSHRISYLTKYLKSRLRCHSYSLTI